MLNVLKKYMSFSILALAKVTLYWKLSNFEFFSLDSLVKNIAKYHFKYLSLEFDDELSDLVNQKGFYSHKYMSGFEKFKGLPGKHKIYSSLTGKKLVMKTIDIFLE